MKIVFENDILSRGKFADNLTKLIDSASAFTNNNSLIIAIDSSWGTGKTTFINNWEKSLKVNGYETIIYNAWESDDWEDAFVPILNKIIQKYSELNQIKEFSENVKELVKYIGKGVAKGLISKVSDNLFDEIKSFLQSLSEDEFKNWFNNITYEKYKELLRSFNFKELFKYIDNDKLNYLLTKKNLDIDIMKEYDKYLNAKTHFKTLLKNISTDNKKNNKNNNKLIFFIDELDRCKPTFAIKTLEIIKHFYNIDNIIFVLSLDVNQLSHSISNVYGQDMDSNGYLRRFFDLHFNLPTTYHNDYINYVFQQVDQGLGIDEREELISRIIKLSKDLVLSLRDINTIILNYKILCITSLKGCNDIDALEIYFYILALKYKYLKVFKILLYSEYDSTEAIFPRSLKTNSHRVMNFVAQMGNKYKLNKAIKNINIYNENEMKKTDGYYFVIEDIRIVKKIDKTLTGYIEDKLGLIYEKELL